MSEATRTRDFKFPFILTRENLSRILGILDEHGGGEDVSDESDAAKWERPNYSKRISIELKQGQATVVRTRSKLFDVGNTAKNPITSIDIMADAAGKFDARLGFSNSEFQPVSLRVEAKTPELADTIFRALEEQIERTEDRSMGARIRPTGFLAEMYPLLLVPAIGLLFLAFVKIGDSRTAERLRLLDEAKAAATDSERIKFLFDNAYEELEGTVSNRTFSWSVQPPSWRFFAVVVPVVVVLGLVQYVLRKCYPRAAFVWGDMEATYKAMLARRQTIWQVIIFGTLVNVMSAVLILGLSGG